tara:strand:- start:393 stop:608 length:216 start_codon:yes stop_codon:yes gene_type:complete
MKSLSLILKNTRNLVPYIALIALYFFFVNIEANKNKNNAQGIDNEKMLNDDETKQDEQIFRVVIPVIPYNQ